VWEGHDLEAETLEPVLARYLATTAAGWHELSVAHRLGVILAKAKTNPTAFLAEGLRRDGRLKSVQLPAWALALNEWDRLWQQVCALHDRLPETSDLAEHLAEVLVELEGDGRQRFGFPKKSGYGMSYVLAGHLGDEDREAPDVETFKLFGAWVSRWRKEHLPRLEALVADYEAFLDDF
jgi:hypothetical protein